MLGLQSIAWFFFFFASYFPPNILYHSIQFESAATVFLKMDLVQMTVFITYCRYPKLRVINLSFKTIPPALSRSLVNLWRASHNLSRNLPGISFSPCYMSANLA